MIWLWVSTITMLFLFNFTIHDRGQQCYLGPFDLKYFPKQSITKYVASIKVVRNRTTGVQKKIPYFIYQANEYDHLPLGMFTAMNTIIEKNPDFSYRYFDHEERRQFIKIYGGKILLDVFDKVIPGTYKANVFRFFMVYYFGGCYFDAGLVAIDSLSSIIQPNMTYITFRDGDRNQSFNSKVSSSIFCAAPRHKILRQTINSFVKSVAIESYGMDPQDITGVRKVTRAFSKMVPASTEDDIIRAGQFQNKTIVIYEHHNPKSSCNSGTFYKLNFDIILLTKYPFYESDMFNYTSKQRYPEFYYQRKVYNKSIIINPLDDYDIANQIKIEQDFRYKSFKKQN